MPCRTSSSLKKSESDQELIASAKPEIDRFLALMDVEFAPLHAADAADRDQIIDEVDAFVFGSATDRPGRDAVSKYVKDFIADQVAAREAERLEAMGCDAARLAYFPPLVGPGEPIDAHNSLALGRQNGEIRDFIKAAVEQLSAAGKDKLAGRRLLMSGAMGTGKTTTAGKALVELLQSGQVAWLTALTSRKVGETGAELRKYAQSIGRQINVIDLHGYGALVPPADDFYDLPEDQQAQILHARTETMCRRGGIASRMAKAGLSVKQTMCLGCKFAETCATKKMNADIEAALANGLPTIFVLVRDYLMLPYCPAPRPHILICDEDFELATGGSFEPGTVKKMLARGGDPDGDPAEAFNAINDALMAADPISALAAIGWAKVFEHLRLIRAKVDPAQAKGIIDQAAKAVRKPPAEAKVPHKAAATMRLIRDSMTSGEAVQFFKEIVEALQGNAPMHLLLSHGQDGLFRRLRAMVKYINVVESCHAVTAGKGLTDQECEEVLSRVPDKSIFRVKWAFKQIRREIEAGCAARRSKFTSVLLRDDQVRAWWLRPLNIGSKVPVLALDGTGVYRRHAAKWGDRLEQIHVRVERQAEVTQCLGGFSRQSLLGVRSDGTPHWPEKALVRRGKVRTFIDQQSGGDRRRVFFAATKKVEEMMISEQAIDQICLTGHFGALRGINAYKHCEIAAIVGREQISARDAVDAARAYLATDPDPIDEADDYIDQVRHLRMRDGSVRAVTVQVHRDPRVQEIAVEAVREAELAQAIDRVRAIFNPRKIFILANVVLDVTVDRVADNLDDLIAGGSRIELAAKKLGGRVLPMTASEHVRLGLASTRDEAKCFLARQARPERIGRVLPGQYLSVVEYRAAGGASRGSKAKAVVGTDGGMDVRTQLEAAVGPISGDIVFLENLRLTILAEQAMAMAVAA